MTEPCPVLLDVLAEIPDFRQPQGRRHPLHAILALSVCAMLCGYRSYGAIAEWGRNYGKSLTQALGFTHQKSPCAATLHTILRYVNKDEVEEKLGRWAEGVLASVAPTAPALSGVAIDGKSLRGSRKQGAPGAHLLAALGHRLGLTVAQTAVADKTNEITAVHALLESLVLVGKVVTVDALLTQRDVAQVIIEGGGDYVMVVKGNQPALHEEIAQVFEEPKLVAETIVRSTTLDGGHGRIEQRRLSASTVLEGYSQWPGLKQVFAVERVVTIKKSGDKRAEVVYGVTSVGRERAGAEQLLELVRHHWHIENQLHWVRDVTFDEDRSQVRSGNIPQVMAALRNTAIGIMRLAGETNIAAACRRFAAQPWSALALIGIKQKTE